MGRVLEDSGLLSLRRKNRPVGKTHQIGKVWRRYFNSTTENERYWKYLAPCRNDRTENGYN